MPQRLAQQIAELSHQPPCRLRARLREGADRVERVEQEMRMELCAKALELGLDEPALQIRGAKGELLRLASVAVHLLGVETRERDAGDDRIDRKIGIEAAEE